MKARDIPPLDANEAHLRCKLYASRLEDSVLRRARELWIIYGSFNSTVNPLRGDRQRDLRAVSINLFTSSCLHEVIMIVCAALAPRPKSRTLQAANLVSFPLIRDLMAVPGVVDLIAAEGDATIKADARSRLDWRLSYIKNDPIAGSLERTRAYRDEHLAHVLDPTAGRPPGDARWSVPPPQLADIQTLLNEAVLFSVDTQLGLFGRRVEWEYELTQMRDSIDAVWRSIAR